MAAGGFVAASGLWIPTAIFVPPGHIIQCIDILWEVVVKNLITHSPESRSGMLKSAMANPRE
jgi:hypothetical protein